MFTLTQHGRFTDTKRTGLKTWPAVVAEAAQFVNASTSDPAQRETLLAAVEAAAGAGEPVALPNGKTLEIDFIEE
jgi:hypothetical protein